MSDTGPATTGTGRRYFPSGISIPGGSRAWLLLASLIALLCVVAGAVRAIDNLDLEIERIEGAGWSAEGVSLRVDLPQRTQARATIARLRLSGQSEPLRDVRIECLDLALGDEAIACRKVQMTASATPLGKQQLTGRLTYQRRDGAIDLDLQNLRVGGGTANIRAALRDVGWDVRGEVKNVAVEGLLQLAHTFGVSTAGITATGVMTGSIRARGAESLRSATATLQIGALTANNEAGSLATEKLSIAVDGTVERVAQAWQWQAHVSSKAGQAYAEPVFLDFGAHAIDLHARGKFNGSLLALDSFAIEHRQVLSASGTASLDFSAPQPVRDLRLDVKALQFPGAYTSYLQPLLVATSFKSLTTSGKLSGQALVARGLPQKFDFVFDGIDVDDGERNFVLQKLRGEWHWVNDAVAPPADSEAPAALKVADSRLEWAGGALLNLDLGASAIRFSTRGRQFRLLEPMSVPLLDGAIQLESFRVRNAGEPTVAFIVDATIQPISAQRLGKAFGWPEFGGSVGGAISKLRMRDGVITLGTTLRARVFDGDVTISDLRLEQPFGTWPRFSSNIGLNNLDLELVTGAFSFGRITGRLSGAIDGLQLFNWQPVAFDARLHTPDGDRSPHRISQRAVENIGSIGGGGAGITQALSSGFLRFFEDFNYERIGISCRLQNEVCQMDGVAPAPRGGYYLVKGKGIPRIDVIGGAHRVDWPRLVQQLIAATESEGPVVR